MAFGRLERPRSAKPMSDINMTPLIDVMLVLLVIFIVTAPLLSSSVKLSLPKSAAATPVSAPRVLTVTLTAAGDVTMAGQPVARSEWAAQLIEAARRDPQTEVHLRADEAAPYGLVAELIGLAQKAGLTRIGFATEALREPSGQPPGRPDQPTPEPSRPAISTPGS